MHQGLAIDLQDEDIVDCYLTSLQYNARFAIEVPSGDRIKS